MYASSAATHGDGSKGFSDKMTIDELKDMKTLFNVGPKCISIYLF